MSENEKKGRAASPVSPLREGEGRPESPTTAQPLDFDDELDTTTPTKPASTETAPKPPPKDEAPPAKPPRPLSAREQAENTLKEAFPTIDASVVKAVLTASGGQVEAAFNALLGMTDPDAVREPEPEEQPPARPPRPQRDTSTKQSQLEADEQYARQLQQHLASRERPAQGASRQGQGQEYPYNENLQGSRVGRPGNVPNPDEPVVWRSFIDDDLPEIRDNIKKGFFETQQTVNKWITNFKKQLDGDEEEYQQQQGRPSQGAGAQGYNTGTQQPARRSSDMRRSADYARYDADPQVIGDDFSKLELRDGDHPPRTSSRPAANPNLFRASNEKPRKPSPGGRKVSFQEGPPEEIRDMYTSSPKPTSVEAPASTKASKWQPLAKVDPSPVSEHDPFSLGDSDDDKDAKPITMKEDGDDRLKKATDEAMKDSIGTGLEAKPEVKSDTKK